MVYCCGCKANCFNTFSSSFFGDPTNNTVRCRYNTTNILHDRTTTCLFWDLTLIYISFSYCRIKLYVVNRFVRRHRRHRRRRRPQILVHAITFKQLLDFFHFWHDCWPWPIDYLIGFWSIFAVTLSYIFQGQIWNLLYLSQKWSDCHETKSKHIDWTLGLKCDHWIWPWPWHWPLFFKVKYRICYISAKNWSDCHKTKSDHIDWTLGLKCDHRVWPWLWTWPYIFKVKYRICYISAKNGPIVTKQEHTYRLNSKASNVTITFDLGHDIDLEFSRSNMRFPISQTKVIRLPRNENQTYRLNSRPQMWPMDLALTITLTF